VENLVKAELKGSVYLITLDHHARRNALSLAMLNALTKALTNAENSPEARVITLSATGSIFCPGHDLKELTAARENEDNGRQFFAETMRLCSSVMQQIVHHPLPIIADVRGVATAAGCQLVASCDLAVATHDASFATPGVNIGLFCSTPMVALSRNVPNKNAMEMLLTGEPISANRAMEIGLINKVAATDEIDHVLKWYTDRICSKSSKTLKIGKQAFYNQKQMKLDEAYDYCSDVMVENMLIHDAEEGINAFIEKRDPEWRNE